MEAVSNRWRSTNLLLEGGGDDKFSASSRACILARKRERIGFNAWLMTRGKGEQECSEARSEGEGGGQRDRGRVTHRGRETVEHG